MDECPKLKEMDRKNLFIELNSILRFKDKSNSLSKYFRALIRN